MNILVIDDEVVMLQSIEFRLLRLGYDVLTAVNGQSGLEIWQREQPQIVLTDSLMPYVSGPELIQKIRSVNAPYYTYLILLTGLNSEESVAAGFAAGADDYITKPFRGQELQARVAQGVRIVTLQTQLRDAVISAEQCAKKDGLTNVFNRREFDAKFHEEVLRATRYGRSLAVVFMDIDHFKRYNDSYGHAHGDSILRTLAEILSANLRTTDFVARYGGDEFVVLLPETAASEAVAVAESIRRKVNQEIAVTLSMGVAAYPEMVGDPAQLLEAADQASFSAKRGGRNQAIPVSPLKLSTSG